MSTADGQAYQLLGPNLTYSVLRSIVFENGVIPVNLQSNIAKGSGNPPLWVEFKGVEVLPGGPDGLCVRQSQIVALTP